MALFFHPFFTPLFSCPSSSIPTYGMDWLTESLMIHHAERSTWQRASGQITSNFQFRESCRNGFYTCSQSKISLLSPRMIGLKLAFTGCSCRWLPYMAQGDFSCFLRSNSTQILIFGVNYLRDPTTRGEEFGCGFGFQKKWWESIRQDCVEYFCVSKHMIYWCNIIWVSGQNHYRTSLLMFLATLLICQARII